MTFPFGWFSSIFEVSSVDLCTCGRSSGGSLRKSSRVSISFASSNCSKSPQYSSPLKTWGGRGWRGSGSLAVPPKILQFKRIWSLLISNYSPLLVELVCMKSLSLSLPGSEISKISYLMFLLSRIINIFCWRFLTWKNCWWYNKNFHLDKLMMWS